MDNKQELFDSIVNRRRSNRRFDPEVPVPDAVIEKALQHAILAPNSSNIHCWEFYWIRSAEEKKRMAAYCLGQGAATTAQQMVVFVTRQDLWKKGQNGITSASKKVFRANPINCRKEVSTTIKN